MNDGVGKAAGMMGDQEQIMREFAAVLGGRAYITLEPEKSDRWLPSVKLVRDARWSLI